MSAAISTPVPATYPEHQKLKALGGAREAVQNFLDFLLDETGFELAERTVGDLLVPASIRREELMARFFEIDLHALENEKQAMLEEIRRANGIGANS